MTYQIPFYFRLLYHFITNFTSPRNSQLCKQTEPLPHRQADLHSESLIHLSGPFHILQPPPTPGWPAWNPHRRYPSCAVAAAGRPGGPPAKVVYVLRDAARAAIAALTTQQQGTGPGSLEDPATNCNGSRWAGSERDLGLLGQCVRAGCLVSLALELYAAANSVDGNDAECSSVGLALPWYAAGAADFLLLQHHFDSWIAAARASTFQAPSPIPLHFCLAPQEVSSPLLHSASTTYTPSLQSAHISPHSHTFIPLPIPMG